ncbi:MAG: hypothetical protein OSJ68_04145 [Clostridia bacterium]|nr:hypothetical protein [Clostridia bacterium]
MSYKSLETKIIKLLPSETLREYIKNNHFSFTQKDLLKFIEDYSPLYDVKMNLLQEAAMCFSDKSAIKHVQNLIAYHKRTFDEFMTTDADCVYEVEIYCNPDDYGETYIVKTFGDALVLIDSYLKYYRDIGVKDNILSQYNILKKTTSAPKKSSDLRERVGERGKCVLGYKRVIKSVEMHYNGSYWKKCNGDCMNCKNQCIDVHCPHFPVFLQPYDLVAYKTAWDCTVVDYGDRACNCDRYGNIVYGILTTNMRECDDDTHVVLLNNVYIRERNAFYRDEEGYYRIYDAHDHPSYAELYKPDLTQIDKNVLADYEYAVQALKEIEKQES